MKLPSDTVALITSAGNKALATIGPAGLNVVPVSMVSAEGDNLLIYDCFMEKTKENMKADPRAALVAWEGAAGVQVKGAVAYEESGEHFERHFQALQAAHPDRKLCGVVVFTPEEVFPVAPQRAAASGN